MMLLWFGLKPVVHLVSSYYTVHLTRYITDATFGDVIDELIGGLSQDPLFVTDVSLALMLAMKDANLNVRIKAAWSLANLCDSLVVTGFVVVSKFQALKH